jgi:c-di-GMP-binding flagellar brake protein YcgR
MTMAESSPQSPAIPLPVLAGSEYDKYMLRNPTEVLQLLCQLQAHVTQLTVFCNEGQDILRTVLLEVTSDRLILDIGADEAINRRVLAADNHYCLGQLERVHIQFLLGQFERIEYQGRPAFRAALPQEVLRLQRREYYRLSTPAARPLKCRLTLPAVNGGVKVLEVNVLDISVGGVGIAFPSDELTLEVGQSIPACRIDLPEIGIIKSALCVRHLGPYFAGNHTLQRAGCEFVNLPGPQKTLIQRYIIKVERERKARADG